MRSESRRISASAQLFLDLEIQSPEGNAGPAAEDLSIRCIGTTLEVQVSQPTELPEPPEAPEPSEASEFPEAPEILEPVQSSALMDSPEAKTGEPRDLRAPEAVLEEVKDISNLLGRSMPSTSIKLTLPARSTDAAAETGWRPFHCGNIRDTSAGKLGHLEGQLGL